MWLACDAGRALCDWVKPSKAPLSHVRNSTVASPKLVSDPFGRNKDFWVLTDFGETQLHKNKLQSNHK